MAGTQNSGIFRPRFFFEILPAKVIMFWKCQNIRDIALQISQKSPTFSGASRLHIRDFTL